MNGSANITDCLSSVTINSSVEGDGTHGGFVAETSHTLNIEGCLFNGSLLGESTHSCGGFIGWRNGTVNISNSLFAPAAVNIGVGTDYPSATFSRNGVSNITNCYYTDAFGTAQGKQRHSISAGDNVTVANAGTATTYDVIGITSYGTGILYGGVLYAGNGDAVSLTLAHQELEGYDFIGYTATAGNLNGSTLTMPDGNVTINAEYTYSAPSELTATDITATTATLNWNGLQESYNVRYRTVGANEWQTIGGIAATTTTLSGLLSGTTYEWQVQGLDCDGNGGTTEWSEAGTFTTLAGIDLTVAGYEEGNGGWVFIASPVAGSIAPSEVHNLFPSAGEISNDYELYRFNQAAELEWENWKAEGTDNYHFNLEPGKGYLYATKETRTLVFAGEFTATTEPVEVPLDYIANAKFAGWNLVGNPFTVNAILSQPYYRMNAEGTALNTSTENTAVAAMEGVFVQANEDSQTVTFTPQTRGGEKSAVAALNISLSKVPEPVEGPTENNGVSTSSTTLTLDNAIIRFDGGQTLEKFSFRENSTKIYIPQDGKDYAIVSVSAGRDAARHVSTGVNEMPVNFQTKENGTYTITVNTDHVKMAYLHLIDNLTGADIDLLSTQNVIAGEDPQSPALSYTFTAKTTDYESRFKLVFSTNDEDGPSTGSGTFAFIDASGNIIITGVETCHGASLQMVDMMGRVLVCRDALNASLSLSTAGMTPGVYVLRLIDGDTIRTQKIVIE